MIYPPVDTEQFLLSETSEDFYLIVSALVPYKRVDLAVDVFNINGKKLVIAGTGPESDKLKSIAGQNITFLGWQSDEELAQLYAKCTALIFPGEEDFGIVPLEAQASGKPVVAFGKGGALETIIEEKTGIFFSKQSVESLRDAVERLSLIKFNSNDIRQHALGFSRLIYKQKMKDYIEEKVRQHVHKQ
jgi:glycosyltransferase involved in cell wall biosynthesis